MEGNDDHFRVYSERTLDASVFCWNPYMDLLSVLPQEKGNNSVSVYRLIDDKQTGSALLFNEKVPFRPTAVGWVPDKRSLTVGDMSGNVFVFDAERQRTIELQKVHDCGIQSIDWVDLAPRTPSIIPGSAADKLPKIHSTPTSIQHLFGDVGTVGQCESHVDDSAVLSNESLASADRQTLLSVLGQTGKVQIYFGGSIPVGEFSISSLFEIENSDIKYFSGSLSPDATNFAVLTTSDSQTSLFLVDTSVLRVRLKEIACIARIESDIDWLLRQFNQSVSAIDRAVTPAFEELCSSLGSVVDEIDDELLEDIASGTCGPKFLQEYILREFSAGNKLSKLGKLVLTASDFLLSTLLSRACVIVDHLTLRAAELAELESAGYASCLGLSRENTNALLTQITNHLCPLLNSVVEKVTISSLIFKYFFTFLESLIDSAKTPASVCPAEIVALIRSHRTVIKEGAPNLNKLLEQGKLVELEYIQLLSSQRRAISSRIFPQQHLSFPRSDAPQLRWCDKKTAELVWTANEGHSLVIAHSSGRTRIELSAPEGSCWLLPRFYQLDELCAVLAHESSASVCVINYSDWVGRTEKIGPETYGFSNFFVAQQIPTKGRSVVGMEVSGSRGLCSILCEGGFMVTLDLENADDDEEEEIEAESSPSPEQVKRGRKNILKKLDSLMGSGGENTPSSNGDSPAAAAVAQRLRFVP